MAGRRISGNMSTMSTIMYFKNPRGGQKSRGARAPPEPPRTAPLLILHIYIFTCFVLNITYMYTNFHCHYIIHTTYYYFLNVQKYLLLQYMTQNFLTICIFLNIFFRIAVGKSFGLRIVENDRNLERIRYGILAQFSLFA